MEDEGFFSSSLARAVRPARSSVARCGQCGLFKGCKSPKMPVDGKGLRQVLIIGEAPGKDEDDLGRPFAGKTGQRLEKVLWFHGVDMRRDCWLYNSAICRPPSNKLDPKAIEYCRPNVFRVIETLKPEVIILLGGSAVKSVIGQVWKEDTGGVSRWVGWRIPNHKPNAWICPTFHPSFVERQSDAVVDAMFSRHLRAAFALKGRPWAEDPPDYPGTVDVVYDAETAASRVRKYTRGLVAVDFETDRLKPDHEDAAIVSCSVCWEGQETIAFPWVGEVRKAVCEMFEDPDVGKIASNMKMEDRWCRRRLGVVPKNWAFDTMLAAHALDPRGGISSIKFQAYVRLGCPDYDRHVHPFLEAKGGNTPNRIKDCNLRHLLIYNGTDSLLEYEVAVEQAELLGVKL